MSRSGLGEGNGSRRRVQAEEQHMQRPWGGRELSGFEELKNRAMMTRVPRGGWARALREAGELPGSGTCGLAGCVKVLGLNPKSNGKPSVFQTRRCHNQIRSLMWTTLAAVC